MDKPTRKPSMIKIGVIGCGSWGPNHIRVFSSLKDCAIVAIADANEKSLAAAGEMFPQVRRFSDHHALLREASADAVVVVTPTKTHFNIVRDALSAGKHVLCEKPLCTDVAEGEQLIALAKSKGLVLMVGHIFLFNSGIIKVKELVDAGEIGVVRSLSAVRTNLGPVRSDVNVAWDLASHDVAVFNWLLGTEPVEVQAMGAAFIQPGVEDIANITMKYPGNILVSIQCSWLDPKKVRHLTLVGSKRMITWDDLALSNPVAVYEKSVQTNPEGTGYGEFLRLSMLDGDVRLPKVQADEPLRAQDSAFVRAVHDGKVPRSDGVFGTRVVRTLLMIENAMRQIPPANHSI
jgi:predicted dehydrogenase